MTKKKQISEHRKLPFSPQLGISLSPLGREPIIIKVKQMTSLNKIQVPYVEHHLEWLSSCITLQKDLSILKNYSLSLPQKKKKCGTKLYFMPN